MNNSQALETVSSWFKPLALIAFAALVAAGCKSSVITPPGGVSVPVPSGGGLPMGALIAVVPRSVYRRN